MTISKETSIRFSAGVALAALAGCASLSPSSSAVNSSAAIPTTATSTMLRSTAAVAQIPKPPQRLTRRSWMLPEAKSDTLLYITDESYNAVFVYTWPKLKLVGELTGFYAPQGLCSDAKGDVFVANFAAYDVIEYAHGGTSPIATLQDEGNNTQYFAAGCAVDPTTGNLAVTNDGGEENGDNPAWGNVAIFKNASGTPTFVSNGSNIAYEYFDTYDNEGNLFIDGRAFTTYTYQLAELPSGSSTFTDIALTGGTIYFPGTVAWDGTDLILGDQKYNDDSESGFYRVSVSGSAATVVSTKPFTVKYIAGKGPACDVDQFTYYASAIVGDDYEWCEHNYSSADVWKYPSGKLSRRALGPFAPIGAAISVAQ